MDRWKCLSVNHSPPFHRKWCLPYNKTPWGPSKTWEFAWEFSKLSYMPGQRRTRVAWELMRVDESWLDITVRYRKLLSTVIKIWTSSKSMRVDDRIVMPWTNKNKSWMRVDWILPRDRENSYQLSLKFEPVQSQWECTRLSSSFRRGLTVSEVYLVRHRQILSTAFVTNIRSVMIVIIMARKPKKQKPWAYNV
jgi:hypothetical protein